MHKNSVQHWVETIQPDPKTVQNSQNTVRRNQQKSLSRDFSFQSDDGSSHCSSVESLLELRKPDPETVLLELGFGPKNSEIYKRIPDRFLHPSKLLPHIDLQKFLAEYGARMPEKISHPTSLARTRPRFS